MAIPFLNNITLDNNEIQNVRLQNAGSPPLNFGPGQIYFDSTQLPTVVDTAKYYANITDTWVSLKEYAFPTGNYITGLVTGTAPKPIITFDLNAVNGVAIANERYLTKSNTWAEVSNGTVTSITAGVGLTGGVITTSGTITLDYNGGNNYILANPNGTAIPESDSSINFSRNTNEDVYITELGAIPVDALTLVKNYIDSSVAGGLIYQGGFDGSTGFVTGTSNYLDNRGTQIAVNKGWTYTVTTAGTFYGEVVEVGDVLIAEDDLAVGTGALTDWTTVQNNVDLANLTQVGIGNVNAADSPAVPAPELDGLSVTYSSGTAIVGLDIDSLTTGLPTTDNTDVFIPYYDDNAAKNKKLSFAQLSTEINAETSFSGTIGNGSVTSIRLEDSGAVAPNINHGLGTDSSSFMIQLVDVSSGETVYADVTRGLGGQVQIDFATAPAINDIRVLIQKIG